MLVASSRRWALVHELRDGPEPSLAELLAKLGPADLVIIEGFKRHAHPKLEVYRAAVRATASPTTPAPTTRTCMPRDCSLYANRKS